MAYINFAEAQAPLVAANDPGRPASPEPAPSGFSGLEWSVVALAQRDRLSSLSEPSRLSMALGALFGIGHDPRLADPKLEALRRMAVLAWHKSYAVPLSEIRAFKLAGFTLEQLETLLRSISSGRAQNRIHRA